MEHMGEDSHATPDPEDDAWNLPALPDERRRSMVWVLVVAIVVGLGCVGGTGYSLYLWLGGSSTAAGGTPVGQAGRATGSPGASASAVAPSASAVASPVGPRASDYPVRATDDLARVCDGWYYPQSPPLAGKAPHPIVVSVKQRTNDRLRFQPAAVDVPFDLPQSSQDAWQPHDPATAQLVACVDLAETGRSLGECDFSSPSPTKVPMLEGIYQVTLYEVATHRQIAQARMTAAGECPFIVLLMADRTIINEVTDRQLYEALHRYVER